MSEFNVGLELQSRLFLMVLDPSIRVVRRCATAIFIPTEDGDEYSGRMAAASLIVFLIVFVQTDSKKPLDLWLQFDSKKLDLKNTNGITEQISYLHVLFLFFNNRWGEIFEGSCPILDILWKGKTSCIKFKEKRGSVHTRR